MYQIHKDLDHLFTQDDELADSADPSTPSEAETPAPPTDIFSLDSTVSYRLFEELLVTYYIPLELWYTRTTIDKVNLELSGSLPPLIS